MDAKDIWLLVAGTVLGFITNILSTFAIPTVGSAFGKLKTGFIERNKTKALANYCLVDDLKSGRRDKYLYALNHWGHICLLTFLAIFGGAMGAMTGMMARPLLRDANATTSGASFWFGLIVSAIVLLMVVRIAWRSVHLSLTLSRVEHFDRYRSELLTRWPDLVLPV